MKDTHVFTTSLPADLVTLIKEYADKFKVPKNRILEEALKAYFTRMKKAEYIKSFQRASEDKDITSMAEEGLSDYLNILDE